MPSETILTSVVTIVTAVLSSGGLWTWLQSRENRKGNKNSLERQALLGLLYDRLAHICKRHIERGYVTVDEYEDLTKYLYTPYKALGGNGTIDALVKIVEDLPKHKSKESEA